MFKNKQLRSNRRWASAVAIATLWASASVSTYTLACGVPVRTMGAYTPSRDAARVVITHDGERVTLSLLQGGTSARVAAPYAIIVPTPEVPVHAATVKRPESSRLTTGDVDAWHTPANGPLQQVHLSAGEPCLQATATTTSPAPATTRNSPRVPRSDGSFGVTVHRRFSSNTHEVAVVSARMAEGLEAWLVHHDYRLPAGMAAALAPYIQQDMKFLLARVQTDAAANKATGPMQFTFRTRQLTLPVRLATQASEHQPQDMLLWMLAPGIGDSAGNRAANRFDTRRSADAFYRAAFRLTPKGSGGSGSSRGSSGGKDKRSNHAAGENFWDLAVCDPCTPQALGADALRQLGVHWPNDDSALRVLRLHVRYHLGAEPAAAAKEETIKGDARHLQRAA